MANPTITPIMTPARGPNVPDAQPTYLVDLYGNPISGAEPNISIACRNGQGFVSTTGILATATNANLTVGFCLFNPTGSGKTFLIFSLQVLCSNSSLFQANFGTADEAFGLAITPQNALVGSNNASVAICDSSANAVAASVTRHGTLYMVSAYTASQPSEALTNGGIILLQPGKSLNVYPFVTTAGNSFAVTTRHIEF